MGLRIEGARVVVEPTITRETASEPDRSHRPPDSVLTSTDDELQAELSRPAEARGNDARIRRQVNEVHQRTLELAEEARARGDMVTHDGLIHGLRFLSRERVQGILQEVSGSGAKTSDPWTPRLELAWRNDQFFFPNGDDSGFTNDLRLGVGLSREGWDVGVDATHRMITERGGMRRTDELDVISTVSRRIDRGDLVFTFAPRVGLQLVGDYGGAIAQDAWHRAIGMGRTLEGGHLQHSYDEQNRAALLVGGRAGVERRIGDVATVGGGLDAQLAIGSTGLDRAGGFGGVDLEAGRTGLRPFAGAALEVARFHTDDHNLTLPGGYDARSLELMPRFRIGLRGDRFEVGWEGRVNEGGSGANAGSFYVRIGGGTRAR